MIFIIDLQHMSIVFLINIYIMQDFIHYISRLHK
jgi:hypothetical protein